MNPRAVLALPGRLACCGLLLAGAISRAADPAPIDLPTALRLAGAKSLDVELAREKVAEARSVESAARARFLPWVVPSVVVRRHENNIQAVNGPILDANKQSLSAGVALNAQVDLGEAYFQQLAAKQAVRAQEATLAGRQRDTLLRVAAAYFELTRARAAVAAAEEAASVVRRHADQMAAAGDAGLAFAGDVARVRGARERAELALERARVEQRVAAARLAELLRLDPAVDLTPAEADVAPLALVAPGTELGLLLSGAIAKRPEMDEAAARLEMARAARRGASVGPLIPTLGAQASFGGLGGGPAGSTLGRDFDSSTDYALGLSWRVGPGGLLDRNRQRETAARERQGELEREKVRDLIRRQVVEQHARWRSLAAQVGLARQALEAADQTARLSRQRRETGVSLVLEDLQAEEELARARRDFVATVAEFNLSQYALRHAAGE